MRAQSGCRGLAWDCITTQLLFNDRHVVETKQGDITVNTKFAYSNVKYAGNMLDLVIPLGLNAIKMLKPLNWNDSVAAVLLQICYAKKGLPFPPNPCFIKIYMSFERSGGSNWNKGASILRNCLVHAQLEAIPRIRGATSYLS
jgi:hypothetical protein